MNRKKVRNLVEEVIAPEVAALPAPEPSVTIVAVSSDDALQAWKRTKQWVDNTTVRGINFHRLESVIAARVEAAFRAGYAAGVGDAI